MSSPATNPLTPEKIELGRRLFFDRRLSPNDTLSCAMCHIPRMPLDKRGWIYSEPNPYNPPGNLRSGRRRS